MDTIPFGRTGHRSTRVLFGAAALGGMRQEKADQVLETLLEFGVNHIDTAASYGDVGAAHRAVDGALPRALLPRHARPASAPPRARARASPARSSGCRSSSSTSSSCTTWSTRTGGSTAIGPGGALEALIEAREQGLVRFLGVTGHGTWAPAMHRRSLERFPFDSVLVPYNFSMLQDPTYAADLEALLALCEARGVAVQTIKSVARRRWRGDETRRFSWYEPLRDADAIARAVHFVLARPGLFLNSSSDATLLRAILAAAAAARRPSRRRRHAGRRRAATPSSPCSCAASATRSEIAPQTPPTSQGPTALKTVPSAFFTCVSPTPKHAASLVRTWTVALVWFCSRAATPVGRCAARVLAVTLILPLPASPPLNFILRMPSAAVLLSPYL